MVLSLGVNMNLGEEFKAILIIIEDGDDDNCKTAMSSKLIISDEQTLRLHISHIMAHWLTSV